MVQPGLSCTSLVAYPCLYPGTNEQQAACFLHTGIHVDVAGQRLYVFNTILEHGACGIGENRWRREIRLVSPNGMETLVAYIEDRCNGVGRMDVIQSPITSFDQLHGRVFVSFTNRAVAPDPEPYGVASQSIAIDGFATLFEILETFAPDAVTPRASPLPTISIPTMAT
jgi:hypothetical protein